MLNLTCKGYMDYISMAAEAVRAEKDYITELDAAIADGDHWLNLMIGLDKILSNRPVLEQKEDFFEFFKSLAMSVMDSMGGTSGALYGSAYLASAKQIGRVPVLDEVAIGKMLTSWSEAIMSRGSTRPGEKTMVDAIAPAAIAYNQALNSGAGYQEALIAMKEAAHKGAEETKDMQAAKGRASNQPNKGVGYCDPGAITMYIQLKCLADYLQR